jgi:hypothetical protein
LKWTRGGSTAPRFSRHYTGTVKGGLAISGLYDLEPIRLNCLNVKLRLDAAEPHRNSPILHLPPMAGPLVVAYGTAELPELCRQSVDYAQAWVQRGPARPSTAGRRHQPFHDPGNRPRTRGNAATVSGVAGNALAPRLPARGSEYPEIVAVGPL